MQNVNHKTRFYNLFIQTKKRNKSNKTKLLIKLINKKSLKIYALILTLFYLLGDEPANVSISCSQC